MKLFSNLEKKQRFLLSGHSIANTQTMFVNCNCILLMYSVQASVLMPVNLLVFNISEKLESGNLNAVGMSTESQ